MAVAIFSMYWTSGEEDRALNQIIENIYIVPKFKKSNLWLICWPSNLDP